MKPVVILKTGRKIASLAAVAGDYEAWIREGMGLSPEQARVIDAHTEVQLPEAGRTGGVVITGSGDMVTDGEAWMVRSAEWLRRMVSAGVPVLGICFGHQLLAHALGGRVEYNPRGVEVGTVEVSLTAAASGDELFGDLPGRFMAQLSHSQSVVALPPGARHLASSGMEPHQAFACDEAAWGIQFHPEFDETIIPHFIEYYRETLEAQGRSVEALLEQVAPAPQSGRLLRRFAQICRRRAGSDGG